MTGPAPFPLVLGIEGNDVIEEATPWIEPNVLALGEPTMLEGDGGSGKTLLLIDWTARVSRGAPLFPGGQVPDGPGGVVFCSPEDSLKRVIKPRLRAAGANFDNILFLPRVPERSYDGTLRRLRLPQDVDALAAACRQMEATLLVLEPITRLMDPRLSSNNEQHVAEAMDPLVDMVRDLNVALLFVRHIGKSSDRKASHRGLGSVAWTNIARLAFTVAPDPDKPSASLLMLNKTNFGRVESRRFFVEVRPFRDLGIPDPKGNNTIASIRWDDAPVTVTIEEALRGRHDPDERAELDSADRLVLEALEAGPVAVKDLVPDAKAAGVSLNALYKALRRHAVDRRDGYQAPVLWHKKATNGHRPHEPIPGPERGVVVCRSCKRPVSLAPGSPCAACGDTAKVSMSPEEL